MNPIIKNKGSAIFIHLATRNYSPTSGCIGLKKKNMIELIKKIKKDELIKIL
jgi:L,D-peptidoglycan transpeptidase YkuD (ErfK/YbiS/YcfS/YnhG family)